MSETYNKNWASEIKSTDVENDGKHNEKQDKVRLAAISLLDDFKARSLPPEQFNRLVEEVKDILKRKDIDEIKLKSEYNTLLTQEKNILNPNIELFKIAIKSGINSNKAIEDIFNNGKQAEFENYLIKNNSERKIFLDKFSKVKIGTMCPAIDGSIFYDFLGKLHLFEFNKKRKEFEQKLTKKLGKENGKKLLDLLDDESKVSACSFDLIKVINDFNKTLDGIKTPKLSLEEIKYFTGESINLKNDEYHVELTKILYENDIILSEIEGKTEKEIRRILGLKKININKQDEILGLYFKHNNGNFVAKKFNTLTTVDIKTIIDGKEKGKSNNDIASDLGKGNPAFKQFNSNYNFSSSVINVPSDNRSEFYSELYKNLDSGKDGDVKTLSSNDGFNFNISKTGNKYRVNYGDRTEICERKEVRNVVEMGRYMNKIGLGFLFGGISRIIEKINSKPTGIKINELDGLDNSEKILGLKSIGQALIPGFDSSNPDIKELEKQFTDKTIFNEKIKQAKNDKNSKFADKLKNNIGNISSLEELAKIMYPGDSKGKDFSIDSFINNI